MQRTQLPCDIGQLVDLNSPILKYLLEIEKKFWRSQTNAAFNHFSQILKDGRLEDSEASLESLRGVHSYALASQNNKRLRPDNSLRAKLRLLQPEDRGRQQPAAFKSLPRDAKPVPGKPLLDLKGLPQARLVPNLKPAQAEVLLVPASLGRKIDSSASKPAARNAAPPNTFFQAPQSARLVPESLQGNTNHRRDNSRELGAQFEANRLKLQRVVKESAVDGQRSGGWASRSKSPYELNSSAARPQVSKQQPSLQFSYNSLLNGSSAGQRSPQRSQPKQRTAVRLTDPRDAQAPSNPGRPHLHLSHVQFSLKRAPPASFKALPPSSTANLSASNYLLLHNHTNPAQKTKQRANLTDRRLLPSASRSGLDCLHLSSLKDKSLLHEQKTALLKTGFRPPARLDASAAAGFARTTNKLLYATIQEKLANRPK